MDTALIEGAIVVVGNKRAGGGVSPVIGSLVGQEEADFTYTTTFPGSRVVSVDLVPCAISSKEHVQDNFVTSARFASNSQEMVILEWFPPSNPTLIDNPMTKAIRKAFEILKPGGTLIIDNHPFFAFVNNTKEQLESFNKLNPFTLVLGESELDLIYLSLVAVQAEVTKSFSSQNPTLLCLEILKRIFGEKKDIRDIAVHLLNLSDAVPSVFFEAFVKDDSGMGYMFLWAWHTFSRAGLIGNCLKETGFDCTESKFGITALNPLNNRKWASILQVRK